MKERKNKSGKISGGVQNRLQRAETRLEKIASRLRQMESKLRDDRETETKILSPIAETQTLVDQTSSGPTHAASPISLDESCVVDLDRWEKKMDEKYALLSAQEGKLVELEKKIHGELEKLRAEIEQRDLLLTAREAELRSLKQSVASRLQEPGGLIAKRSGERKAARWVSFLVDIGKKH